MAKDTGKELNTSTGSASTKIPALAKEHVKEERPLQPAQIKPASNSSCKTLADILSLIQEDLSQYQKALAKLLPKGSQPVLMKFNAEKGGIIYLASPPGHTLDTGIDDHILLDGIPVTGWEPPVPGTGKNKNKEIEK